MRDALFEGADQPHMKDVINFAGNNGGTPANQDYVAQFSQVEDCPKSSLKRVAAKKARESPLPRLSFPARLLRIHALRVKKHHNPLIWRHLPNPAFYSAVLQNALAGAR